MKAPSKIAKMTVAQAEEHFGRKTRFGDFIYEEDVDLDTGETALVVIFQSRKRAPCTCGKTAVVEFADGPEPSEWCYKECGECRQELCADCALEPEVEDDWDLEAIRCFCRDCYDPRAAR